MNGSGLTATATAAIPAISSLGSETVTLTVDYDGALDGIFVPKGSSYSLGVFNLSQGEIDFHYDPASLTYTLKAHGVANLLGVGVTLDGYLNSNGTYDLEARTNVNFDGLELSNVLFDLTDDGFSFQGQWTTSLFSAPFTATVDADYTIHFDAGPVNGFLGGIGLQGIQADFDLGPGPSTPAITLTANADLPILGSLPLTCSLVNGQFSFSAAVPSFDGFALENAVVTLSAAGIALDGQFENLPLLGNIELSGQILDANHFSLQAQLPTNLTLAGFSLQTPTVSLSNAGIELGGSLAGGVITSLFGNPLEIKGLIVDANTYSLSAQFNSLTLGGFTLKQNTVTFDQTGLSVSGQVKLPLFGNVVVAATIPSDGTSPTISANLGSFSLLGGLVQFNNETLQLEHRRLDRARAPTRRWPSSATSHFTGSLDASGDYSLTASADINVGGFDFKSGTISFGSGDGGGSDLTISGITFPTPFGDMTVGGSYSPSEWSLSASLDLTDDPIEIGPVAINEVGLTFTDNSSTNIDSISLSVTGALADIDALAEATGTVTIWTNGEYDANIVFKALSFAGYSMANATVDFGDHNPSKQFIATLNAHTEYFGMDIALYGYFDGSGNYDFKGVDSINLDGLSLANADFEFTNENTSPQGTTLFSFGAAFNFGVFDGMVSGSMSSTGEVKFNGDTDGHLGGFDLGKLHVDVDLNPLAANYLIDLSFDDVNVFVATLNVEAKVGYHAGTWEQPTFTATTDIGGALSSVLSGTATFTIDPSGVTFTGNLKVPGDPSGQSYNVRGTVHSDGTIQIGGFAGKAGALLAKDAHEIVQAAYAVAGDTKVAAEALFNAGVKDLTKIASLLQTDIGDGLTDIGRVVSRLEGATVAGVGQALGAISHDAGALAAALENGANYAINDVAGGLKAAYGLAYATISQGLAALTSNPESIANALANGAGAGLKDVAAGLKAVYGSAYATISQGLACAQQQSSVDRKRLGQWCQRRPQRRGGRTESRLWLGLLQDFPGSGCTH